MTRPVENMVGPVPEGWLLLPAEPTAKIIELMVTNRGTWRDRWEAGKKLQRERGLDVVPAVSECEEAAGLYMEIVALAVAALGPNA